MTVDPRGPGPLATQARMLRARASESRRRAQAERERTEELAARLAQVLGACPGRPFGDRGERFYLRLGRVRPLVGFARQDFRRWLERGGVAAEVVDELVLACSEACANAVEHPLRATRQAVELEASRVDGLLELRVRDFGTWHERTRPEQRGRGLALVRGLVDSLDVRRGDGGTQVVMRRSLSGRPSCS